MDFQLGLAKSVNSRKIITSIDIFKVNLLWLIKKHLHPNLHPWKLTWHWKIPIFNRKYIFKWWIFHCHVSFLGCRWWELLDPHLRQSWDTSDLWLSGRSAFSSTSGQTRTAFPLWQPRHFSIHLTTRTAPGEGLYIFISLYLPNWGGGARFPSAILTDVPSKTQNWTLVLPQRRFCPLGPNGVNLGRYSRITFRILYVSAKMITAMTWCWQCEGQLAEHLILKSLLRHSSQQSIVPIGKRCSKQTLIQNEERNHTADLV